MFLQFLPYFILFLVASHEEMEYIGTINDMVMSNQSRHGHDEGFLC